MKLDFAIIGGQKCGSTYLQEIIYQHPNVQMVEGECPHFESPDYENDGLFRLNKLLKNLDQSKCIGIKRPNYLSRLEVPERIKKINRDIKLILILRNPLERLRSAYFHYMNYGFSPVLPLNEGVEKILSGKLFAKYHHTASLIEFGFYAKFLKIYLQEFDHSNLLVLLHDDLKKDKLSVIRRCYSFLNIDTNFVPHHNSLESRPQKVNYSLIRTKILAKKNRFQFSYNNEKTRLFVKDQTEWDKLICRNIDRIDRYIINKLTDNNKKPQFNERIKRRLHDLYNSEIEELEKLLSVDLTIWKG
ncbi:MAG: sulfotransferase domain-containing protein [Cyclobacteriaceae bacterium]